MIPGEDERDRTDTMRSAASLIMVTEGPEHRIVLVDRGEGHRVGRTFAEAFPELDDIGVPSHLDRFFRSGEPGCYVVPPLPPVSGHGIAGANLVCRPMRDAGGDVKGLLISFHDRDDERGGPHLIELLRTAQATAVGTLASSIAHELSQPLTAIGNYAAGIRRALKQPVRKGRTVDKGLEAILDSMARAGEILGGLRALNRRGPAIRKRLDWDAMMRETVIPVLAADLPEDPLRHDFSALRDIAIRGDRRQIEQVLITLISNACDAVRSRPYGRIHVIATPAADGLAQVRVEDNGRGVADDLSELLFDGLSSAQRKGAGFGLAVSRAIVEAHGGTIRVTKRAGGGTCVTFTLAI